ncbi:MAG: argininosuccinate synthase [Methanosarcinales archaeon]|nr:MAG: argininosuccinate synthase [Methanosarcinales archaeon]
MKKVVLSYSGGLDTSVCIPLLREHYGFDSVVTVTTDVGQPDLKEAEKKGKKFSDKHYTIDAKDEFVHDYIFPAIKANGNYEGYVLGTALARPLIAKKTVEVALKEKADALAHGCTGKGNDQFRFEAVFRATNLDVIAPMRDLNLTREEEIEYAKAHDIPVSVTKAKPWSVDENLWSRSIEGGELEDPSYVPPEEIFQWTAPLEKTPNRPTIMEIGFERGVPVALNGKRMDGVALIQRLNEIGGQHGVGRTDIIEDRILGLKARENYEHPAATILLTAHKDLEQLVLTRDEIKFKMLVDAKWAELAYHGLVDDPLFTDLSTLIDKTQERVTGEVKVQLLKGNARVVARKSPKALYSKELVSFDAKMLDSKAAEGYAKFYGLQARLFKKI